MMPSESTPKDTAPQPIFLKDYRQPDFWIPKTDLHFDLDTREPAFRGKGITLVRSRLQIERNGSQESARRAPLVLNGDELQLVSVQMNGQALDPELYTATPESIVLHHPPDRFSLEIVTALEPGKNLSCEGLYRSSGMYCTQCEAESFRRITYFLDRPDVMSVYSVTIEADRAEYPILLSNGNLVAEKDLAEGRHEATWHDPHKKPCYLFALVAGNLGKIEDRFTTRSGRDVLLQIFSRPGLQSRCLHAMESLKLSMKWDEDTYGLEYDLDRFMIVVAEDFNMGAMENKGLNIFNANYVLADPQTATDHDFNAIAAVVAHEYFHNWTGNRVTCRDWFQLSLKEGLTVFRDQRFSADVSSEGVHRIDEVIRLRTHQFAEDGGPTAHPVRPQSYISIDNFYTLTIYEKGAEVIRMIETIVGREGFRRGMDLYFKRHDGQAVTTEDFVAAMADANNVDLSQFKNWYDQAGTPVISVKTAYLPSKQVFTITIEQRCPPTPGQAEKKPFHIPVAVGLIGSECGKDLPLQLESGDRHSTGSFKKGEQQTAVLHLRETQKTFTFTGVTEKPVLSLLRGFSAPVRVEYESDEKDLAFLIANDADPYCRWEAAQTLTCQLIRNLVSDHQAGRPFRDTSFFTNAFQPILATTAVTDPAFASFILSLPAEQYLAQFFQVVDVEAIFAAREHLRSSLARAHAGEFSRLYGSLSREGTDGMGPVAAGRRALKNRALDYLVQLGEPTAVEMALQQTRTAKNMTEELGALEALNRSPLPSREIALGEFYEKWKQEPLVMNKWLTTQAVSPLASTLDTVIRLSRDPVFDKNNPNKIYSLFSAFSRFNPLRFHDRSGAGYRFIADQVLDVDARNPQVASRLMGGFGQWRHFDAGRQQLMKAELGRILAQPKLSANVFEMASKMLNDS